MSEETNELNKKIFDAVVLNTGEQYPQAKYKNAKELDRKTIEMTGWKNDVLTAQIGLISYEQELTDLSVEWSDFTNAETGSYIPSSYAIYRTVKSVKAYKGLPDPNLKHKGVPAGNREESADVLYSTDIPNLAPHTLQPLWLNIWIRPDTAAGLYEGTISVTAAQRTEPIVLDVTIDILNATLESPENYREHFDVEFWQNPYAFAEYYGVEVFSDAHFEQMIPHLELYKMMGGNAVTATIVEEAWDGQTYSKNEIKFPSMVKWQMKEDGRFTYDYRDFDRWIEFTSLMNLGDKIACYTLAPWTGKIGYYDETDTYKELVLEDLDSSEYAALWTDFLKNFLAHTEALGIKERIFIAIDERGLSQELFDIVHSVKGSDGKPFNTAGALDSFITKRDLSEYITDLTVGTAPIKEHPEAFKELIADRKAKGLKTTIYSCTGHIPGNFSLSEPEESYWTILFSYAYGAEGFLRWAYDSWVENPLADTSHYLFESGDTFLVFPDEKDAKNPEPKRSIRLEKFAEGVRDVQKLDALRAISPEVSEKVDALLTPLLKEYKSDTLYLAPEGKESLLNDVERFKENLDTLTKEVLEAGHSLDVSSMESLEIVSKEVKEINLPEMYQSVIEKAPGTERQYLGQPDMIVLDDEETLITVYPVGHGKGPLVMQVSEDAGETWIEKTDIPESWSESYETPVIYKLDLKDGRQKLMVISGRPAWHGNKKGGWDTSISDDQGKTWTEWENHHAKLPDGQENWSTVAMASLIRLKDAEGEWDDRWLGVYHNADFVNYKSILSFDENGQEQWTTPEPYLFEYRLVEKLTRLCEVHLFRSPDGETITALGRTNSHEHASVIFHSHDEGDTWTKPAFLPYSLFGERHKSAYVPGTDKLVITFRAINPYMNENGDVVNWRAGDWSMWVGRYEDLLDKRPGEALIVLAKDYTQGGKGGDTGYAGLVTLSDGTIVTNSYGHFDEEFSSQWNGPSVKDLAYIMQAKFKLSDLGL